MPLPYLPDDVFIEILSHFFQPGTVEPPSSPPLGVSIFGYYPDRKKPPTTTPTPFRGSTSLLLTSKRIRELTLPFFWRSITIYRPSDFVSLFDPKIGLLHVKGKAEKQRRDWIRELSVGSEAAVPYDIGKIDRTFSTRKETNNLFERQHSSHAYLYNKIVEVGDAREAARRNEPGYVPPEGMSEGEDAYYSSTAFGIQECFTHDAFSEHLDRRNVEIVASLLSPVGAQLRTLHLPLDDHARMRNTSGHKEDSTFDPRIPSSIKSAKGLLVRLTYESVNGSVAGATKTLSQQLPSGAQVQVEFRTIVQRERFRKNEFHFRRGDKEVEKLLERWSLVEEDGSLSSFVDLASRHPPCLNAVASLILSPDLVSLTALVFTSLLATRRRSIFISLNAVSQWTFSLERFFRASKAK
ncbi:hypothetical protein BDY24DRAFT_443192 [Mrakia frigida]|uniref:uncharacterized protein n=1 Tax=Mrakia frigida TaxID=29902 RepID=UPI003FCC082A